MAVTTQARTLTTTNNMIEVTEHDEYGCNRAVAVYESIEDARDGLNQLECALEDATNFAVISRISGLIDQLEELIREHEEL